MSCRLGLSVGGRVNTPSAKPASAEAEITTLAED